MWRAWARCWRVSPSTVPGVTVNRLCSSALESVNLAAKTILAGGGRYLYRQRRGVHEPGAVERAEARSDPEHQTARHVRHHGGLALQQSEKWMRFIRSSALGRRRRHWPRT